MGYFSRQPDSNEPPEKNSNPWGPADGDDVGALLTKRGERCSVCKRVVMQCHLQVCDGKNYCPDHYPEGEQ
jgi:hypothetical protein